MVTAASVLLMPGSRQQQDPLRTPSPPQGLVFVYQTDVEPKLHGGAAKYNLESYSPETTQKLFGERRQNSKSCFERVWTQFSGCSIPECKWQFYAIAVIFCILACIGLGTLYFYPQMIGVETWFNSTDAAIPDPTAIILEPKGPNYLPDYYEEEDSEETKLQTFTSIEEDGNEPAAPPTKNAAASSNCSSVTYGDGAVLNCPRAHVLNLTVVFNQGYNSLGSFLAQFPNLKNLTLDFEKFCPERDLISYKSSSLFSLEQLTILNSKSCHHLSSGLSFKLPNLQRLVFKNVRLDMQFNRRMLVILEDACLERPHGTLKSVEIWNSEVCKKCGFEFDECEAEPSSEYNYIKYFEDMES